MNIAQRIQEVEQKFNTTQAEREELIKQAEDKLAEMNRLQGDFRTLQELQTEDDNKVGQDKEPSVSVKSEGVDHE